MVNEPRLVTPFWLQDAQKEVLGPVPGSVILYDNPLHKTVLVYPSLCVAPTRREAFILDFLYEVTVRLFSPTIKCWSQIRPRNPAVLDLPACKYSPGEALLSEIAYSPCCNGSCDFSALSNDNAGADRRF